MLTTAAARLRWTYAHTPITAPSPNSGNPTDVTSPVGSVTEEAVPVMA
jgi:hypothetical protein